jgi:predicted transcriptional regulator
MSGCKQKTTIYLNQDTEAILDKLVLESRESRTAIINSALIFYADRGAYMEALVKRSIREALNE